MRVRGRGKTRRDEERNRKFMKFRGKVGERKREGGRERKKERERGGTGEDN